MVGLNRVCACKTRLHGRLLTTHSKGTNCDTWNIKTSAAKLSEPCECQLLRVTLPVPFEEILLVIISVHFGKSRNPYARPDASPPQGRGRGQMHSLSPLVLLCPTMMILMMRRSLYTTRHQHRKILDSMKSSLILDFTLKISEWYNYYCR